MVDDIPYLEGPKPSVDYALLYGEEGSPGWKSFREPVPGIYEVCVRLCQAERPADRCWLVSFDFAVVAPDGWGGTFFVIYDTEDDFQDGLVGRVFAVLGAVVRDEVDFALACREVVGRHAYVEVLPDGDVHVLQLATTQAVATPFASGRTFPAREQLGEERGVADLSDPDEPRFHGCDFDSKVANELHPFEEERAGRYWKGVRRAVQGPPPVDPGRN